MIRKIEDPEGLIKVINEACTEACLHYDLIWKQEEYEDPKFKKGVQFFAWLIHELMATLSEPIEEEED